MPGNKSKLLDEYEKERFSWRVKLMHAERTQNGKAAEKARREVEILDGLIMAELDKLKEVVK